MFPKTFVTGADGFIGSHVVEELVRRGHRVTALVNYNSLGSAGWLEKIAAEIFCEIETVAGDVRDASLMKQIIAGHTSVIHLASLIAIPYSYLAPQSYVQTNAVGTLNVLEAARSAGISRFVHTSTSEVYGSAQYVPIDEKHPLVGQSPYSASKIAADQLAFSFWASFELPVTTVRPFNVYGPRQSQRAFIPSVIVQLLSEVQELKLGSLAPTRDLTFVSDTARGFADAVESESGLGETFNMGSEFEISMGEVVEMLAEIAGYQPSVKASDERIRPAASEVQRLLSDSSKITSTFGWRPEFADKEGLKRGLEATYVWFEQNHTRSGYNSAKYVL